MVYPSSRVIDQLDLAKWSEKIEVRYFNRLKGKGLIARERIEEGDVIWKEDPFVIAPEWYVASHSYACTMYMLTSA